MAAPTYTAGAFGNLIALVTVGTSKIVGAFLDLSTSIEGKLSCLVVPPASPVPSTITTFSLYKVFANATPITMSSATSTSITLSSTPASLGIFPNQIIGIQQTSGHGGLGEVVKITSISTNTLNFAASINTYASGDYIYVIDQIPMPYVAAPSTTTGVYSASTPESAVIVAPPDQYFVGVFNGDGSYTVQVAVSLDKIPSIQ